MTAPLDLDALLAALAKATRLPWYLTPPGEDGTYWIDAYDGEQPVAMIASGSPHNQDRDDAELICLLTVAAPQMIAEITTLRETVRAERRRATDAEYMRDAYRQMLGAKGKKVADMWQAEGLVRIHTSWGLGAASLDGEGIAEAHLRMNEAAKDATPIDDIDGEIEQQTHAEFARAALNPEGSAS